MGTFNTSLNLFTNDTLPVSVDAVKSKDFSIDGNYSEYGRLVLTSGVYEPLSLQDCGPKGAFVFAQSLPSNGAGAAIKLYVRPDFYLSGSNYYPVSESVESFATLYPGDTAMIPVTPQQRGLMATVTQDGATLDYYIGDRGGQFGHSVSVMNSDTTYKYFLMDVGLGEVSKVVDTGIPTADWTNSNVSIVNDKGYVYSFSSGSSLRTMFVNSRGETVSSSMPTMDYTSIIQSDNLDYYGYVYFYSTLNGTELTYFDGDNAYTHAFSGSTNVYLDYNWEQCNNMRCFVAYVTDYNGVSGDFAAVLINKDKAHVLNVLNYSGTNQYANTFLYNYAGFVFLTVYDDSTSTYKTFEYWDANGNLIKRIDVSSFNFDSKDVYFYGTGKLQLVFNNTLDTSKPFYMMNYDETTDVFHGDDLTWWHEQGTNFTNYTVYAKDRSGFDPYNSSRNSSYLPESMAIVFYSGTADYNYYLNYAVNYADITYLFPESTPKNYVFAENSTSSWLRITNQYETYPTSNNVIFNYNLVGSGSGDLNALLIADNGVISFQVIPDISVIYNGSSDIKFEPVGDYVMYAYYNPGDDQTYYKMVSSVGVMDTLTLNGYEFNYRFRYNSLFIRTWSYANYNWYFNAATAAFTQLSTFYSQRYFTYGFGDSGINNGLMLLVKPDYYSPTGSISARVLSSNSITDEVNFTVPSTLSYYFYLGSDSVVYSYIESPDYANSVLYVQVYDLGLNLKRTMSASFSSINYIDVVNDRTFVDIVDASSNAVYYLLTQTTEQKKVVNSTITTYYEIDDAVWY